MTYTYFDTHKPSFGVMDTVWFKILKLLKYSTFLLPGECVNLWISTVIILQKIM